ncbi:MAG: DnaJ domain-containing protein [Hyphomicrobiales bacterium]
MGGLWVIRRYAKLTPQASRNFTQKLAAACRCCLVAGSDRRMNVAVPLFLFGLGLIGKTAAFPNGFPGGFGGFSWPGSRSSGQKSRVATALLSMELDHDSGGMDGDVLAGPSKGRRLSSLSQQELITFHVLCTGAGDQSKQLLEAWLERNRPEWRDAFSGTGSSGSAPKGRSGPMSREEALAVLGLSAGASAEDVKAAHRRLMKDFHPDKGGSDYLAAKINAAKDVLLEG